MKKRECSNCRYIRKTKEFWCKCTGNSVNPDDPCCYKWEKGDQMKCDICRKEFENSGVIFAKKKDGLDLRLCPECTKMVCNKIERIILKGLKEGKIIDSDSN